MKTLGTQFLHEQRPDLHKTQEVQGVVDYLNQHGERIPNQPAEKVGAYLGFLADKAYVNDGILTGDKASIERQIDAHVIKSSDVPEGYFELQRRIAREQGHGDIQITSGMREQLIEAVQADQHSSLEKWVEYLGGNDGSYPDWFKHYTWNAVLKLGNYDKDQSKFLQRSKGTTAPYPELNREALAYVYDKLNKHRIHGKPAPDQEALATLLKSANFGRLYAHAVLEVTPDSPELKHEIQGSWTKFHQTGDPRTARRLSGSLQGHGTGWCTAGESTAADQLAEGDFYVYYTRDEDNRDTVPRVAIRMQHGEVAEVRGVNASQELEPIMADITSKQLKDLPGGEAYIKKAEDMKRLTGIHKLVESNPEAVLTKEDVNFLYELDHDIEGFGYSDDPRINEIRRKRGERDHAELKVLAVERLRTGFEASFIGYKSVVDHLPDAPRASEQELRQHFEAKLVEWQASGVLDYVAERIVTHGELYTPVMTPNTLASYQDIARVATAFGKDQPDGTYICSELYSQYSPEELSGELEPESPVRFSLIPNTLSKELGFETAQNQRTRLAEMQRSHLSLNIRIPSVLDAVMLWQTLRARGDRPIARAYNKTLIRHIDLRSRRVVGGSELPYSFVGGGGKPILFFSYAEGSYEARVAVG